MEELEDVALEPEVVVFPNPTNDNIKVKLENWNGEVVWELRNAMGALVRSGEFVSGVGYLLNVEMSSLASGVYSLSIEDHEVNTLNWVVKK